MQAYVVVDAFTSVPFEGNPAAVVITEGPVDEGWMRLVAREMNLSETAFLHPAAGEGPGVYSLRWLTPAIEVDLCGHATLAASHVLWESGRLDRSRPAQFLGRSGRLTAEVSGEEITLDFPAKPCAEVDAPEGMEQALGAPIAWCGMNGMDYLVQLRSAEEVRGLRPDFTMMAKLPVRGTIVTAASDDPQYDFVSRFFAPGAGVSEDPVTGSAHCALGPFWAERLGLTELVGRQVSERGGTVRVAVRGDRVKLGGRAVTVSEGVIRFGP